MMISEANELVHLECGALCATVARKGAELVRLQHEGRSLLWSGDPLVWDRCAPLLFPVVGRSHDSRVSIDGRSFEMPSHGFARDRIFQARSTDPCSARFELAADEATLQAYPFRFRLTVEATVRDDKLSLAAKIANENERPMPFGFGYHPGFLWPEDAHERARYVLRFESDEDGPVRRADLETGLLLPEPITSPLQGRTLLLDDDLFTTGSVQFERVRSRSVWFGPAGETGLRVAYPDSPQLGIWTKPGAPFLCIEPWQGLAAETDGSPELAARPGMRVLMPGEAATYRMTITVGIRDPDG
jgi:galactose mutarotase-like enzyme